VGKARVLLEFWDFLRQQKKYWLAPIVLMLILFGLLLIFTQTSALAPFIYTLF
jgi:drug/metabolite transporter superfamily protein YnfA